MPQIRTDLHFIVDNCGNDNVTMKTYPLGYGISAGKIWTLQYFAIYVAHHLRKLSEFS